MANKLLSIIFFLALTIFFPQQSIAQSDPISNTTSSLGLSMPGVNCGLAGKSSQNICCEDKKIESIADEVDNRFPDFACLLDVSIPIPFAGDPKLKGFCISDLIKPPVKWVANIPAVQSILNLQRANPVNKCVSGEPKESGGKCTCVEAKASLKKLCDDYLKKSSNYNACVRCAGIGVYTGIGCIPTTPEAFASLTILRWPMGLAGGISFLCILYSAFLLQTSRGNPEKIKKAREYLTNCLIGLGVVLFSIFILRLVGIDILRIPGFN